MSFVANVNGCRVSADLESHYLLPLVYVWRDAIPISQFGTRKLVNKCDDDFSHFGTFFTRHRVTTIESESPIRMP